MDSSLSTYVFDELLSSKRSLHKAVLRTFGLPVEFDEANDVCLLFACSTKRFSHVSGSGKAPGSGVRSEESEVSEERAMKASGFNEHVY